MICFNGIYNDLGWETEFYLYIDPRKCDHPYITDYFVDKHRYDAIIDRDICVISGRIFRYKFKVFPNDEIILMGKEVDGWLHKCFPCIFRPRFFVATNKLTV